MTIYGSNEGFQEYFESRGQDIPGTWDDTYIAAALLVASEWVDGVYGPQFSGYKTGGYNQEREWPRAAAYANVYPCYNFANTDIPDRVVNATYEAAFRQATTPGSLSVDYVPGKYKSVSVDGAISVDYAQFSSTSDVQMQIAVIDVLLWPLLNAPGSGGFSGLSGPAARV